MIAHTFAIHGAAVPQCCCHYLTVNFRWTWTHRPFSKFVMEELALEHGAAVPTMQACMPVIGDCYCN